MTEILLAITLVLVLLAVALLLLVLRRSGGIDLSPVIARCDVLEKLHQRFENTLTSAIDQSRQASEKQASGLRIELQGALKNLSDSLVQSIDFISQTQQKRLEDFANQLNALKQASDTGATALRGEVALA
jgi:hypothetical protein